MHGHMNVKFDISCSLYVVSVKEITLQKIVRILSASKRVAIIHLYEGVINKMTFLTVIW